METKISAPTKLVQAVVDLQVGVAELRQHTMPTTHTTSTLTDTLNRIDLAPQPAGATAGPSEKLRAAQPPAPAKTRKGKEPALPTPRDLEVQDTDDFESELAIQNRQIDILIAREEASNK
jgi:hypothetical protein